MNQTWFCFACYLCCPPMLDSWLHPCMHAPLLPHVPTFELLGITPSWSESAISAMRNSYYTGAYSLPSMFSPASRGWQQQVQPSLDWLENTRVTSCWSRCPTCINPLPCDDFRWDPFCIFELQACQGWLYFWDLVIWYVYTSSAPNLARAICLGENMVNCST
jgi:hypothetical protein